MSMEKTIIYLKAEQSSYVDHEMIHIGDIASVYCGDKKKEEEIRNIILYEFDENKEKEGRILFIGATCFFGTGITVMGYNNDVDMAKVFRQLYRTFVGQKPDGPTFVELFYSIGLALGVFLFFNHVPGKKVTNEPTPIQVQMRLYEQDVNQTFLLGASRKGEELDVAGNSRDQ